jgi:hypothetical protein
MFERLTFTQLATLAMARSFIEKFIQERNSYSSAVKK